MKERVEIVIIGCGDVTRKRHARLCAEGKKVHLRGFYSRSRRSAEAVAERYPAKVYGSLEEVLADPSTDAVLIATPEQTHSQIALQALEAGKHVLCEKPMAASRKEAVQMRETALVHNRKLMVNFNQRLYPEHQKIRELVGNGEIGRVLSYYTAYETRGQDCRPDGTEIPGFYDQIQHRHGVLAQVGVHKIDLMPYLLGSPVEQVLLDAATQVKTMGDGTPIPYEDRASLHLRHQNGAAGLIHVSWQDFSSHRETRLCGTKGTIVVDSDSHQVTLYRKNGEQLVFGRRKDASLIYQEPLTPIVERFGACILEDTEPFVTGEDGIRSLEVLEAAYRSQKQGGWSRVDA